MLSRHFWSVVSFSLVLLTSALFFAPTAWAATYTVSITATQFIPSTLKIATGDSIMFINTTSSTQSAKTTVASGGFNTGNIGPGSNKTITVSSPGTFTYTSQYSPSLTGTVTVSGTATSDLGTGGTATDSSTTANPAQTQEQPVSGVAEVLFATLAVSAGLIFFGGFTQWRFARAVHSDLVEVPTIGVHHPDQKEQ